MFQLLAYQPDQSLTDLQHQLLLHQPTEQLRRFKLLRFLALALPKIYLPLHPPDLKCPPMEPPTEPRLLLPKRVETQAEVYAYA